MSRLSLSMFNPQLSTETRICSHGCIFFSTGKFLKPTTSQLFTKEIRKYNCLKRIDLPLEDIDSSMKIVQ